MPFDKAYVPYGGYWTTPYSKWQGSFANLHAMKLAGQVAQKAMAERKIDPKVFDQIVLGMTIPQTSCFYGTPWMAGLCGCPGITGPMVAQACATGAQCANLAAGTVDLGMSQTTLVVTCDRCSNGPHLSYASQTKPGATPESEDWVWDNFGHDPWAKNAMIETAENVAKEAGIPRSTQDEVALLRYQQYLKAKENDGAFHKRYMVPVEVNPTGRKVLKVVSEDEGIFPTTAEGLAGLKPVLPNGSVTFGSQTHPADGNTCMVVTTREKAKALSQDPKVEIQILGFGQSRVKKGYMAMAVVPAARAALSHAGIGIKEIKAITTHNPFAVNDIYFCQQMGTKVEDMNRYGSSMIWGHPQGPTGLRAIIECIEEVTMLGGGYGLFAGCAAGDSAGAVVFKVDVA